MFKKIFTWIKELIVEEYKFIIFMTVFTILFFWPVNYYVIVGGDISNVSKRVSVTSGYESKGSFNICFVSELDGRLGPYLLSYVIPGWERESANDYKYDDEESIDDINFRSQLDLISSNSNAIKWAYKLANKSYEEIDTKVYIISVMKNYNDFKVGDQIIEIDGVKIKNNSDVIECVDKYKENDIVKVKVIRKNKEKVIKCKIYKEEDRLILGIYVQEVSSYKTDPKVTLKFKRTEQGPSAGLITALSIYDQLTKGDLTKSLKIAGTGTIESDGTVGSIGGVKYKLAGAVSKKADVFLVPAGENYKEAIKYKKKNHYDIKIIGVSNLEEAILELEKLEV